MQFAKLNFWQQNYCCRCICDTRCDSCAGQSPIEFQDKEIIEHNIYHTTNNSTDKHQVRKTVQS